MAERPMDGAIVAITNTDRTKFFIQQKDMTYLDERYRMGYTFFGGGIEKGEDALSALERELAEELDPLAKRIVMSHAKEIGTYTANEDETAIKITLFESALQDDMFYLVQQKPIMEGIPKLALRGQLLDLPFIYGIEKIVEQYLDLVKQAK